jgi:hypothetical protein
MAAVVSLFGGEIFEAIIDLGDDLGSCSIINGTLPSSMVICFHIDPTTRETIPITFGQVLDDNPHLKL